MQLSHELTDLVSPDSELVCEGLALQRVQHVIEDCAFTATGGNGSFAEELLS